MTQINPFTGALIMGTAMQQRQVEDKERQIRRIQNLTKNTALQGDDMDRQVENADAVRPAQDYNGSHPQQREQQQPRNPQDPQDPQDDQPHIDVKG